MLQPRSEPVMQTSLTNPIGRRGFLKGAAASAGALLIPLATMARSAATNVGEAYEITDWVRLGSDGRTIIGLSQCEVGQGVYTGLPQVLADEMDADWRLVSVEFVTGKDAYRIAAANEPLQQFVGASMSVTQFDARLRIAGARRGGAVARRRRESAYVLPSARRKEGHVVHPMSGRSVAYGALAADAARLPSQSQPALKPASQRSLIARSPTVGHAGKGGWQRGLRHRTSWCRTCWWARCEWRRRKPARWSPSRTRQRFARARRESDCHRPDVAEACAQHRYSRSRQLLGREAGRRCA